MDPRTIPSPSGSQRPSRALLFLLALLTALYAIDLILRDPAPLVTHLALIPRRALGREPWQLLTSALLHRRLGALLGTVLSLWFFGAPLERELGRAQLFALLGISTLMGSLATAGIGLAIAPDAVVSGALPASLAVVVAFGLVGGQRPVALFGVARTSASMAAALFLGIAAVVTLMHGDWLGLAGGVAGAGVGALFGSRVLDGLGAAPGRWARRYKRWRIRRRYRVIPGGRDTSGYLH